MNRLVILSCLMLWLPLKVLAAVPAGWPAEYPEWWYDSSPALSVIDVSKLDDDANYSPINQGQLLHMTERGIAHLDAYLPGGAGFNISIADNVLNANPDDYYAPVNIGQLKNVASKFYDRFKAAGFGPGSTGWPATLNLLDPSATYPWSENVPADGSNYALANIGQARHLFSWNLSLYGEVPPDGFNDAWEISIYGNLTTITDANGFTTDYDGDLVPDYKDADPRNDNPSIPSEAKGVMRITIEEPINGAVFSTY